MTVTSEWRVEEYGAGRFNLIAPVGRMYTSTEFRKQVGLLRCPVCSSAVSVYPMPMNDLDGNTDKFMPGRITCLGECSDQPVNLSGAVTGDQLAEARRQDR